MGEPQEVHFAFGFYPLQSAEQTRIWPFFQHLKEGRLTTTKCAGCGAVLWQPRVVCPDCNGGRMGRGDLPGGGPGLVPVRPKHLGALAARSGQFEHRSTIWITAENPVPQHPWLSVPWWSGMAFEYAWLKILQTLQAAKRPMSLGEGRGGPPAHGL